MAESKYNVSNSKNKNVINTSIDITDDSKHFKHFEFMFIFVLKIYLGETNNCRKLSKKKD